MFGVDALKRVHGRAVDLTCGRPLVFHHVPKCAGTSVGRAVRRAYLLSQGTVKPHESEWAFDAVRQERQTAGTVHDLREMMLLYLLFCDTRCVAAHVPFSNAAFDRFAGRYAFVTILRDPVDRFLSHYRWWKRPNRNAPPPEPLEAFVQTPTAREVGSSYVRYFSGQPGAERFTSTQVAAAIDNLKRLHFVGFLDELPRFEAALRTLTGQRIRIGKENIGVRSTALADVSPEIRASIREVCRPDIEVWDAVQHLRGCNARQPSTSAVEVEPQSFCISAAASDVGRTR